MKVAPDQFKFYMAWLLALNVAVVVSGAFRPVLLLFLFITLPITLWWWEKAD